MLYKKNGMPEEGEIVLCAITKIHYNSVFANLNEYENKQGMIHISEISPGRIRNIRDFVEEGKIVICKVLSIDKERGHIDLSLRRVNESQKRIKSNQIKQEQLAEKILEIAATELKVELRGIYDEIIKNISKNYDYLYPFFEKVSLGEEKLGDYNLKPEVVKALMTIIEQRIKPPIIEIKGDMKLQSYEKEGVEDIKKALIEAQKLGGEKTNIRYLGSGTYHITITDETYKAAEETLKKVIKTAETLIEKSGGSFEFKRQETK